MYVSYHMLPAVLGYLVLLSASAVLLAYCTSTPAVPESILVYLCVCAYVHACVYHWDSGEGGSDWRAPWSRKMVCAHTCTYSTLFQEM